MSTDPLLGIVSHARSANVPHMQQIIGLPVRWYVGAGEAGDYRYAGAADVVESGNIVDSNNAVLEDAFAENRVAVRLADDLRKVEMTDGTRKWQATFAEALAHIVDYLRRSPYKLGGIAPTNNAFFYREAVSHAHFIVGDVMVVLPSEPRFDPRFKLKEDYDFTCQHITRYGGVARMNGVLCTFQHKSNRGGAMRYTDLYREDEAIALLKEKWGTVFRDNPRREREVLMKWGRP